jgi:small subunit ribosomal protein S17
MTGKVVSNKMNKAVIVEVVTPKMNTKYKKAVNTKKRYPAACTDSSIFTIGQAVEIISCRPISKTIQFKVVEN